MKAGMATSLITRRVCSSRGDQPSSSPLLLSVSTMPFTIRERYGHGQDRPRGRFSFAASPDSFGCPSNAWASPPQSPMSANSIHGLMARAGNGHLRGASELSQDDAVGAVLAKVIDGDARLFGLHILIVCSMCLDLLSTLEKHRAWIPSESSSAWAPISAHHCSSCMRSKQRDTSPRVSSRTEENRSTSPSRSPTRF